jgi:hypothetical protein
MVRGPDREFNQDTGVNTPYSYNTCPGIFSDHRESGHRFNVPSERQHLTQDNVPNHCPGGLRYFWGNQRKECLLLALQHHFQQHLVSHPGPTLLSFRASQQWDVGWYAAGKVHVQQLKSLFNCQHSPRMGGLATVSGVLVKYCETTGYMMLNVVTPKRLLKQILVIKQSNIQQLVSSANESSPV